MSFLKRLFKGKKGGFETISTMSPEQRELFKSFSSWVRGRLGKGLPEWTGDWVAPLSEYEETALGHLADYLKGEKSDIAEFGLGKYKEALSGMSPEEVHDWYMKYVAPSERLYMKREIIPRIREEYIPTGSFYGTPRFEAVGKAWEDFAAKQLGRIAEAIASEREGARRALSYLPAMVEMEEERPLRVAEAGMRLGALPRLLRQRELESEIEEFKRTTPELSPILDAALQLLQTDTKAAYYRPYKPSPFVEILEPLSRIAARL